MTSLTPLDACLAQALAAMPPVLPEPLPPDAALGLVLAADVTLPHDLPPMAQALRAGLAVAAFDLVGASAQLPVPLAAPHRVLPGEALPPGTDAVLPEDGAEAVAGLYAAIRPIAPGEGVRLAGHDGWAGEALAHAGQCLTSRHLLLAGLAGIAQVAVRVPRVRVALDDPAQVGFAADWLRGLGARITEDAPHLILRPATDHTPRLALSPGDTGWLERMGAALVLTLPPRFDGMLAALFALGLPAMAALSGAIPQVETRPLARKVSSALGLSELVLLRSDGQAWDPTPPGTITAGALARAQAIAILPPESEGLPAGAPLAATPIDSPFG